MMENYRSTNRSSETASVCAVADNEESDSETEDLSPLSLERPDLAQTIKKEQSLMSIEDLLEECCMSKECKDETKNTEKIRFKTTKTPFQLAKLQEALAKHPSKFPKRERVKLAKEIGLDEVQIYKWYYDNKPAKINKRAKKEQNL